MTIIHKKAQELATQFALSFTKKDITGIGRLLADDFSLYDPALKWIRGKQAVLDVLTHQFKEIKHINYEVINSYRDGNTTILEFKIKLDDKILYGVDFMIWEKDLMKELRCYYNPPHSEILKPFSDLAKSLKAGSIYQHYKGNSYKILSVGRHSESLEESVVYQGLYGDYDVWVRPITLFFEEITIEGKKQPRFKVIS